MILIAPPKSYVMQLHATCTDIYQTSQVGLECDLKIMYILNIKPNDLKLLPVPCSQLMLLAALLIICVIYFNRPSWVNENGELLFGIPTRGVPPISEDATSQ